MSFQWNSDCLPTRTQHNKVSCWTRCKKSCRIYSTRRDKSSHLQRHIISTILLMLVITEETWNASWRFVFFSSKLYTILISFMYFEIGQTYDIHESGDKIITCPLYRAITCRVVLAHLLQAMTCMPASYW